MSEVLRSAGTSTYFSEGSLGGAMGVQLEGRSREWRDLLEVKLEDVRVAYFQIGKVKVGEAFGRQEVRDWLSIKGINTVEDLLKLRQDDLELWQGDRRIAKYFRKGMNRLGNTILTGPGGVMVSHAFGRPVEPVSVEAEVLRDQMIKRFMNEFGEKNFRKVGKDYFGWETGVMLHQAVVAPMNDLTVNAVYKYLKAFGNKLRRFHPDLWQYVPFRLDSLGRVTGESNYYDLLAKRSGHLGGVDLGQANAEERVPVEFHRALRSVYGLPYTIRPGMKHLLNVREGELRGFYGKYEMMGKYLQSLFDI